MWATNESEGDWRNHLAALGHFWQLRETCVIILRRNSGDGGGGTDVLDILKWGGYLRSWAKSCITKPCGENSKQLSCVYMHRWEERWSPAWSWDQTQRPRGDFFYISATGGNQMPFSWGILDLGENAVVHGWMNVCCKCFKRSVGVLGILISSLQPSTLILLY